MHACKSSHTKLDMRAPDRQIFFCEVSRNTKRQQKRTVHHRKLEIVFSFCLSLILSLHLQIKQIKNHTCKMRNDDWIWDYIQVENKDHPVVIWSRSYCVDSIHIKRLFQLHFPNVALIIHELNLVPDGASIERVLENKLPTLTSSQPIPPPPPPPNKYWPSHRSLFTINTLVVKRR